MKSLTVVCVFLCLNFASQGCFARVAEKAAYDSSSSSSSSLDAEYNGAVPKRRYRNDDRNCANASSVDFQCTIPAVCTKTMSTANSAGNCDSRKISNIEVKFMPLNPVESCNIRMFCRSRAPGSYCYVGVSEIATRKCDCTPVAYVECPFGAVNLCERGFKCVQTADDITGSMSASCERLAVTSTQYTVISVSTELTSTTTSLLPSSALVAVISTIYAKDQTPQLVATSVPFTTYVASRTVFSLSTTIPVPTSFLSATPITLPPYTPLTVTLPNCSASIPSSVSTDSIPRSLSGIERSLCRGPYPISTAALVVVKCPFVATKTSSIKASTLTVFKTVSASASARTIFVTRSASTGPTSMSSLSMTSSTSTSTGSTLTNTLSNATGTSSPTTSSINYEAPSTLLSSLLGSFTLGGNTATATTQAPLTPSPYGGGGGISAMTSSTTATFYVPPV